MNNFLGELYMFEKLCLSAFIWCKTYN